MPLPSQTGSLAHTILTTFTEAAPMPSRHATRDDVDRVTETLTLAFLHDPVWGVALAPPDGSTTHHAAFWRLYVEGSLRYSTVYLTEDVLAVSGPDPARGHRPVGQPGGDARAARQDVARARCRASDVRALATVRGQPPAREAACLPEPARDAPGPSWSRDRATTPRGGSRPVRCGRGGNLPGVDQPRQRPPIPAGGLPPDRWVSGRARQRADLHDVAPNSRIYRQLGKVAQPRAAPAYGTTMNRRSAR